MKVRELIETLSQFDGDMDVYTGNTNNDAGIANALEDYFDGGLPACVEKLYYNQKADILGYAPVTLDGICKEEDFRAVACLWWE